METGDYFWYPWFPERYRLDTQHLTAEQDGIYRRLIDYYMESRQPLPDNDIALARIAGVSIDAWTMAAAIVRAFFASSKQGKLHHKRCDLELDRQDNLLRKHSEKGKKGAEARWKNRENKQYINSSGHAAANAPAIAIPMLGDSTVIETETIKEKNNKKENFILPEWIPSEAWRGWEEMRRKKNNAPTGRAKELAVTTLSKLRAAGQDLTAVIDQSTMNGYAGFFPVQDGKRTTAPQNPNREVA